MRSTGATGRVVFITTNGDPQSRFLWITDGTEAGTIRLANIIGDRSLNFDPTDFATLGDGRLVFNGADNLAGSELWVTDGTVAGTTLLTDIDPSGSSFPNGSRRFPMAASCSPPARQEMVSSSGLPTGPQRVLGR